ncbi:MAG: lytic transglycosylase domain-containing protein [Patescibacteria group bacterium]|nr:lytic transglycosylase domain-containing protein [Patescibacteria group bacterium]
MPRDLANPAVRMAAVLTFCALFTIGLAVAALGHARTVVASADVSVREVSEARATPPGAVEKENTKEGEPETEPEPGPEAILKPESNPEAEVAKEGLSRVWPQEILALEGLVVEAANMFGHDPNLVAALIKTESWFSQKRCPKNRPDLWGEPGTRRYNECKTAWQLCPEGPATSSCTSVAGAKGPAQVMPYHFFPGEDGRDLSTNIYRGAEILRDYTDRKGGNIRTGLAAYYCGPNKTTYPAHCWSYVEKVMGNYGDAIQQ